MIDYDPGAVKYPHDWAPISTVSCKNGSEKDLKLHIGDNILKFHASRAHI
jgi:hypothetical protein